MSLGYNFENTVYHNNSKEVSPEKEALDEEIHKKIEEIRLQGNSIGLGKTAEVFISEHDPNVCYKIIHSNGNGFRNNVRTEADFLGQSSTNNNEVKIPKPYYSIISEGEPKLEVLVMERLHATSVKDIIEKKLKLPENFDLEKFYSALEKYFKNLHDSKRIHHRDAHGGNIMIDDETGQPCVIDFGTAAKSFLSSENPYIDGKNIFTDDMIRIREIWKDLRVYIYKRS